jgi:S-adenosylmethionine:diacylglycerol 3-amino-3-carboxypropyl transferase
MDTAWRAGRFDDTGKQGRVLFGRMYEDAAIERAVFPAGGRVFCIASAGCTALALCRDHDVVACDINPEQLAYARRRIAGAPAEAGMAEHVMTILRRLAPAAGWRADIVDRFLALDEPGAQLDYWRAHLDTRRFRAGLSLLLSVTALRTVYSSRLLAALPERFAGVLRLRMERCFGRYSNRDNPYARLLLTGQGDDAGAPPRAATIELVHADAAAYLESCPPGCFDGVTLSNILDGSTVRYSERLLAAIHRAAKGDAPVVLRSFSEPGDALTDNRAAADRSMLWGIVEVRAAGELAAPSWPSTNRHARDHGAHVS